CFEAVGGFPTEIEVYYEDVDFCLGARAAGFGAVLAPRAGVRRHGVAVRRAPRAPACVAVTEPRAVVVHDGIRGFAAGLTPWAAFLKARNPWLLVRRRGSWATWPLFVPTYAAMVGASALGYVLRGRLGVAGALRGGALPGISL